jgi:tetratricopeptide (TPR) repeat protein
MISAYRVPPARLVLIGALTAVAVALASPPARAQTEAQKLEAKEHYTRATRLYEVGKYNDAIEEYQKVYLLVDDPNMLFNIAQCHKLSDRPEEAVRFYRNFLRRSPNAPNRALVEKLIAEAEKAAEERKRTGVTPPPSTTTPPPNTTTPPPDTTAPPGTGTAPPPVTQPPPVTTPTEPIATVIQPAEPPPPRSRVLPYTLLGVGGALIVTSVISGAVAAQKAKELTRLSKDRAEFNPSLEKSGKAANAVAIATGLTGVAVSIVGGIFLYNAIAHQVAAAPGHIALYPIAGPQVAGAGASVTF